MTQFQFSLKRVPAGAFMAGANAYAAGFHFGNNPHKSKPARQQWAKGYFTAKAAHEGKAPKHRADRDGERPRQPKQDRPVISMGRLNRFNTKHRTQV